RQRADVTLWFEGGRQQIALAPWPGGLIILVSRPDHLIVLVPRSGRLCLDHTWLSRDLRPRRIEAVRPGEVGVRVVRFAYLNGSFTENGDQIARLNPDYQFG